MGPFLVDWWDQVLAHDREARSLAHAQRLLSPELLGMYNRVNTYRWVLDESRSNPFRRTESRGKPTPL
jgi:hypothetical protein